MQRAANNEIESEGIALSRIPAGGQAGRLSGRDYGLGFSPQSPWRKEAPHSECVQPLPGQAGRLSYQAGASRARFDPA